MSPLTTRRQGETNAMARAIPPTSTEHLLTVSSAHREPQKWSFTVLLSTEPSDAQAECLYARCSDTTLGVRSGVPYVAFDRLAMSLADAVDTALHDIEATLGDVRVVRIEPEELVNAADIARRTGRTRASIAQLVDGARGPGHFPAPRAWVGGRPLWDWLDAATWFAAHYGLATEEVRGAAFLSALNGALSVRRLAPQLTAEAERHALARVIRQDIDLLQDVDLLHVPLSQDAAARRPRGHSHNVARRSPEGG